MTDDLERTTLIEALTRAEKAEEDANTSLLGRPSLEYTRIVTEAIEASPSFQAVSGRVLYSANSLIPLHPDVLTTQLSFKTSSSISDAVDWLLKVLRTKFADGYLVAAIWGLTLDAPLNLPSGARLVPFEQLRDSLFKKRLVDRAQRYNSYMPWLAPSFWQLPTAAYIDEINDVQYIGRDTTPIQTIDASLKKAIEAWPLIEILGAGRPLVLGSWFEYLDESLDISHFENTMAFFHAEVAPRIRTVMPVTSSDLGSRLTAFEALPEEARQRLLRAATRFSLSQCRREEIDRVLDLALAFEIALGGGLDTNAGISWKLAVRAAQLIGGSVTARMEIRKQVNNFYGLRSRATHGQAPAVSPEQIEQMTELFQKLFLSLVQLARTPNWNEIEIEAVPQA